MTIVKKNTAKLGPGLDAIGSSEFVLTNQWQRAAHLAHQLNSCTQLQQRAAP